MKSNSRRTLIGVAWTRNAREPAACRGASASCTALHARKWRRSAALALAFLVLPATVAAQLTTDAAHAECPPGTVNCGPPATEWDASDSVGATPGEFRVDESGAATYRVPIVTAPASGGYAPGIALDYSSRAPHGPMGPGWSISGVSSIARCRRHREFGDSEVPGSPLRAVDFSDTDAFCLDGQRLLPAADSGQCPARAGATVLESYRTELESWRRACAYRETGGAVTSGPTFWLVQQREGGLLEFGTTGDSRVLPFRLEGLAWQRRTDRVATWLLARSSDPSGNFVAYEWDQPADGSNVEGDVVLLRIRYTGNARAVPAVEPYNRIEFEYEEHSYESTRFDLQAGSISRVIRRLRDVVSYALPGQGAGGTAAEVRRYRLAYASASNGSRLDRLTSITECAPRIGATVGQTTCYPPTTFEWFGNAFQLTPRVPETFGTSLNSEWARLGRSVDSKQGDVDGDGLPDLVWIANLDPNVTGAGRFRVRISESTGDTLIEPLATPVEIVRGNVGNDAGAIRNARFGNAWFLFDFNGDGRDDLLRTRTVQVPQGFQASTWQVHLATLDNLSGRWTFTNTGIDTGVPSDFDSDARFGDFDGDGLPDLVVVNFTGAVGARVAGTPRWFRLVRSPANGLVYRFQTAAGADGPRNVELLRGGNPVSVTLTAQRRRPIDTVDLNGDGRSDLLVPLQIAGTNACNATIDWYAFVSEGPTANGTIRFVEYDYIGRVANPGQSPSGNGLSIFPGEGCEGAGSVQTADLNGDGLPELLVRTADKEWRWRTNLGSTSGGAAAAFGDFKLPSSSSPLNVGADGFGDRVYFFDVNGDGRADVVYPKTVSSNIGCGATTTYPWMVRRWGGAQWGDEEEWIAPGFERCQQIGAPPTLAATFTVDLDANGGVDLLRAGNWNGSNTLLVARGLNLTTGDRIARIVNGLGSETQIQYLQLTAAPGYTRRFDAPNAIWGYGSPVFEVASPMYVVVKAESSAPTESVAGQPETGPASLAAVQYKYTGARLQAGGRGFLGFASVQTFDLQNKIETTTAYCQNFPFTGRPAWTQARKIVTLPTDPEFCALNPGHPDCRIDICPTCRPAEAPSPVAATTTTTCAALPEPSGEFQLGILSLQRSTWQSTPAFSGTSGSTPFFVSLGSSTETIYRSPESDAADSAPTGPSGRGSHRVETSYEYDTFGNPSTVGVVTHDDSVSPSAIVETLTTTTSFSNDAASWRIGRPLSVTITSNRPDNDPLTTDSRTRTTAFEYDVATGVLTDEIEEPSGSASLYLRTAYVLDSFGNRTATYRCSNRMPTRSACIDLSTLRQRGDPSDPTYVHRYQGTTFDPLGRYPTATTLPFFGPASANEVRTATATAVIARNALGSATQAQDANAVATFSSFGSLGRERFGRSSTGGFQRQIYAWCSSAPTRPTNTPGVACPGSAVFRMERQSTAAAQGQSGDIAPRAYAYFDRLGREVLTLTRVFQPASGGSTRWSATRTTYDALGRVATTSVPYLSAGPSAADPEAPASGSLGSVAKASLKYSVASRIVRETRPESANSTLKLSYDATAREVRATTQRTATESFIVAERKNALGETERIEDATAFVQTFDYAPFGTLEKVSRTPDATSSPNVRNVDIVTRMQFDTRGRKVGLIDPDKGAWTYTYNALGELITQVDAKGQTTRLDYDALGRLWRRSEQRLVGGTLISESLSTWEYDTADAIVVPGVSFTCEQRGTAPPADTAGSFVLGALAVEQDSLSQYRREHRYDTLARRTKTHTRIDGEWFTECATYDRYGRAKQSFDASGEGVANEYSPEGYVLRIREAGTITAPSTTGPILWERLDSDARGNVTRERLAGAASMETTRVYNPATGRLESLYTS
ncbi:MAG: FG-GAP-like repeat-containing protein, partial [Xanthomonadaceae bacterium]|nr:FG-GAP-like repeat-containing protein [Xanthomonadaceae bacterium]